MSIDYDRTVHASRTSESGDTVEVVRYDRQGRWYREVSVGLITVRRERISSVQEAVQQAIDMEKAGGQIFDRMPGGKQFDAKVAGARGRMSRQ